MRDEFKVNVQAGSVVQLNQNAPGGPTYVGCFMIVTEAKAWGAEGYLQVPVGGGKSPERVPFKAQWREMEYCGHATHYSKKAIA